MKFLTGTADEVVVKVIDTNGQAIPGTTLFIREELRESALMLFLSCFALPVWVDEELEIPVDRDVLDRDGRGMALFFWFKGKGDANGEEENA